MLQDMFACQLYFSQSFALAWCGLIKLKPQEFINFLDPRIHINYFKVVKCFFAGVACPCDNHNQKGIIYTHNGRGSYDINIICIRSTHARSDSISQSCVAIIVYVIFF